MLRIFQNSTRYTDAQSFRICQLNGFVPDSWFAIKCYMKTSAMFILAIGSCATIIIFGLIVLKFEQPFPPGKSSASYDWDSVWNAWWCMILTMTTVGYGEIFPVTVGGRIFTILACIIGVFVVSMIIAKLTDLIALNPDQEAAYEEIMNEQKRKKNEEVRSSLVQRFIAWRLAVIRKKPTKERFQAETAYTQFKAQIQYQEELIEHLNPQLGESIEKLSSTTLGFIKSCADKLEPMQTEINDTICDVRKEQVGLDKKALEMYDITYKLVSFVCMTNRMGRAQALKSIDRLKMFFSSDGIKNKHLESTEYLQRFMEAREPLIKFNQDIGKFKNKFEAHQQRKLKREEERKRREEEKKKRLEMIEKGFRG